MASIQEYQELMADGTWPEPKRICPMAGNLRPIVAARKFRGRCHQPLAISHQLFKTAIGYRPSAIGHQLLPRASARAANSSSASVSARREGANPTPANPGATAP